MRHPGALSVILADLAAPLILGSPWSLAPAVPVCAVVVLRTALEDRALFAELPGYADYEGRVRRRLVPLIW